MGGVGEILLQQACGQSMRHARCLLWVEWPSLTMGKPRLRGMQGARRLRRDKRGIPRLAGESQVGSSAWHARLIFTAAESMQHLLDHARGAARHHIPPPAISRACPAVTIRGQWACEGGHAAKCIEIAAGLCQSQRSIHAT